MSASGWRLFGAGLRGQGRPLRRMLAWSLVEALPALASGTVVARALDEGFLVGRPGRGLVWLGVLTVVMLVSAVATRALYPWLGVIVEGLRDHLVRSVAGAALRRAVADAHGPGGSDTSVVARLTEQVESVRRLSGALLRTLRQLAVAVVASVVGVTSLAPVLGLVVAPPLVLALGLFWWLLRRLRTRQRDLVLAGEVVAARTGTVLAGLRDVVACRAGQRARAEVGAVVDGQARAARALAHATVYRSLVVATGGQLPLVAVLAVGPWLVRSGRLSAGELVGAVTYVAANLEPALRSLVQVAGSWGLQLDVVLGRLAEVGVPPAPAPVPALAAANPTDSNDPAEGTGSGPNGAAASAPGAAGPDRDLCAVGLTFGYGRNARPVVRELDLRIEAGEHLTIVGPSGAGKSTLAALLCGLIRPGCGEVRLGGRPLDLIDPAELRRITALIPQQAYVFAGTVRENLGYLDPDIAGLDAGPARLDASARLDAAVASVGAGDLIARLGGYDAPVRPGDLSGGERQLLAAIRVYLSPARVVVLDEATSLLDPAAEARVERAFAARPGTLVVVAHRISSALRADRVLLLDGGHALVGDHRGLLARSPRYAELLGYWQADNTSAPPSRHAEPAR